jgi:cellulose biosynthesis protein BcsQ
VLIDTPPSLNLYAQIALITTDYLIIPSDLKPFANEGLKKVYELVQEIEGFRTNLNLRPINILGVLPTKISTNTKFIQGTLPSRLELVKSRYQINVMDSIIYEREDLAKCMEGTLQVGEQEFADPRSILDFQPSSKSVEEFDQLAREVLYKIGLSS